MVTVSFGVLSFHYRKIRRTIQEHLCAHKAIRSTGRWTKTAPMTETRARTGMREQIYAVHQQKGTDHKHDKTLFLYCIRSTHMTIPECYT